MSDSIDRRVRSFIAPVRVSWPAPAPAAPAGADRLMHASTRQPTVWQPPLCRLSNRHTDHPDAPFLLLDFGQELHGGLQVVSGNTPDRQPVPVRIRFGESVSEAIGEPNQNHAIHDHHVRLPWCGQHEVGNTGFRFASIALTGPGTFLALHGVQAVSLMDPAPWLGSFECDDARLNQIWQTSARTVHLCMQDYLWDGIKRDRLVWAGDVHPEVMAILSVFGHHPIVPRSLNLLRDQTPLPEGWMNGMPTYSLWWLITWRDWWFHTGRIDEVQDSRHYIVALAKRIIDLVDARGDDHLPSRFLDWAIQGQDQELKAGSHALLCLALEASADLCEQLQAGDVATTCRSTADRMRRYAMPQVQSQQAGALRVLAKMEDAVDLNRSLFAPGPFRNLSPFYGYYVLEARAQAGDHAGCLALLRDYWGAMLDLGATSFWEHLDVAWLKTTPPPGRIDEWPAAHHTDFHRTAGAYCYQGLRHSLCHGWSAGPAAWLIRHVLGIIPAAPGCKKIRIDPHLCHLRYAQGTFPTPAGVAKVSHEAAGNGNITTKIELPTGVTQAC